MSREQWQRIEELYHSALERAPDRRAAFLADACADDDELRREVESLLRHSDSREAFVDRPAWEAAGELLCAHPMDQVGELAGRRISHYEIMEKLGEGGMGAVYKARDTRLGRLVAIKTLPRDQTEAAECKRRFVLEARAASALNHPNIVNVFEIDEIGGIEFIAMEYVPGKTLGEMIGRKRLPVSLALDYAVQIAGALAAAHAAGIVHRDLKPANVMVTENRMVKLLDFGVAKLTQQQESTASLSSMPAETEKGSIVGTTAYMSPEQAQGKTVDVRSDIFSFGAVLYEMVTGRQAFRGDSQISTLAAIIEKDPKPVRAIAEDVPELLERLILQCLRKQPARRFQHMDDVKVELEALKEDSESGKLSTPAGLVPRRRNQAKAWMLAPGAVAVLLVGAGASYLLRPKPIASQRAALTRLTWDSGLTTDPVLSPDGTRVAYASDRDNAGNLDIWIQQVATGDRLRLTQNSADEHEPAFSPDGNRIAYRSEQDGGGIYVVSALGGEPKRLVREGRRPRFSPNGELITYWVGGWSQVARVQGSLFVIPAAGGEPRQIRADFKGASNPEWLPDGRHILFLADQGGPTFDIDVWVTSLDEDGTPAVRTGLTAMLTKQNLTNWSIHQWIARGPGDAHLLLSAQSGDAINIWRIPISSRTFQLRGPAEQLTFGTASAGSPQVAPVSAGALRMVFANIRPNRDIWSLALDANRASVKGQPQRVTDQESDEYWPGITEDGRKLVYQSNRNGSETIWAKEFASGREKIVSIGPVINPLISRDGRRVFFRKPPAGPQGYQVYMIAEGDPVLVCKDCFTLTGVSRDGEFLLDEAFGAPQRLRVVTTDRKEGVTILKHATWGISAGRLSPDDRWIAFHAIPRIDARQVYVAPFRGPVPIEEKDWIPVTDDRGMERYADWSPDGNTLYFLSERDGFRCIRAQRLDPASKHPMGPPLDVYHFHHARLSLMNITDPVYESFHIAVDKAVLAIEERTGNIWMTELPGESR